MNSEFRRIQQLAGLLTEVNIAPPNISLITKGDTYNDGIEYNFDSKNKGHILGWWSKDTPDTITFSVYIENNTERGVDEEKTIQELAAYLKKHNVYFTTSIEEDGVEAYEYFIHASLPDILKKRLLKK
jgi:hypothetical protein